MRLVVALLVTLMIPGMSAFAAESRDPAPGGGPVTVSGSEKTCVPVNVRSEKIFCLRDGVGAFTADERATAVGDRLEKITADRTFDTEKVRAAKGESSYDILAGDLIVANLTEKDARANEAADLDQFANASVVRIREAIAQERSRKTDRQILFGSLYSLIVTIVVLALLRAFSSLFPRLYAGIVAAKDRRIHSLRIQTFEILTAERMVQFLLWVAETTRLLLTLLVLYVSVPLVLSFFPWTANLAPRILSYILDPLREIGRVVLAYIPKLFFVVVIFFATRFVLRIVSFFFIEIERGNIRFAGFYQEWAQPTYKLARVFILAFALVMAFPYLPGAHSPAFQGVSVFIGVIVSFGSSSAISNIVAGIVLTYMRPFTLGDRVKIADTTGDVIDKTLLVTRIRTIKNVDITIPNAMVLGSHIINYSSTAATTGLVLNTSVTIGYDADWRVVHRLLLAAAARTSMIVSEPPAFVLQTSLDDFYVAYEINAYTREPNRMAVIYSELHQNIQDCFNEAGVEIMSPHYAALRDGNDVAMPPGAKKI